MSIQFYAHSRQFACLVAKKTCQKVWHFWHQVFRHWCNQEDKCEYVKTCKSPIYIDHNLMLKIPQMHCSIQCNMVQTVVGWPYLIFVTSTTSSAGVKFFSLVSKNQESIHFSSKNLDLACFCGVKNLIWSLFLVSKFELLVSKNDKYEVCLSP